MGKYLTENISNLQDVIFINIYLSRYVVEALDRTLGGDWFQVGEASPGDKKVLKLVFIILNFSILNLISDR